ncbi:phosphatidylinositol kinase [Marmoricola endophyticus]|uniref:Phosphatidylinositol kinase n=1 Tax=Marmoricola endophyticus TaxID=2040280 RepID=A0A917EYI4_9ACTN|nr:SCO1664 family protein [Marmoricola endophyticus]GGF34230.1 phosphatidylinositol kinase [Marmoricola endophyticus]
MSDAPPPGTGLGADAERLLGSGEVVVTGRVMPASNHTFLADLVGEEPGERRQVVYKPTSGERPLWDFTDGTLADREYAAYLVSQALDWGVVPPTVLREGPVGRGMVQLWCEPDDAREAVDLVPEGPVPDGYRHVLEAIGADDRPVQLVHDDSAALRRMAVFDVVTNNTDRKGGHVLAMADGHRYGVDHGICFHVDDKLRTVLWGFAGEPLTEEEVDGLERLEEQLRDGDLAEELPYLLTGHEIARTRMRTQRLLRQGALPQTHGGWPSIPWPPF